MGRPRRRAPNRADPPVLTVYRRARASLRGVIPEIDIWGVANLMLKRYGNRAQQESARHADELWAAGDATGEVNLASGWRRNRAAREHDTSRSEAPTQAINWIIPLLARPQMLDARANQKISTNA